MGGDAYLRDKAVNYRVVLGDSPVARMYGGVESLPTAFLIDREGWIAAEHVGLAGKSTYEGQILKLLNSAKQPDAPDAIPSVGAEPFAPILSSGTVTLRVHFPNLRTRQQSAHDNTPYFDSRWRRPGTLGGGRLWRDS